jgi:hypothetical protein
VGFVVPKTRKMPAVISTFALIAGCGSSTHAEVSGVVVDARTGHAIAGARVIAEDGSTTRTDENGHFTLSLNGSAREIRVSAEGRIDGHASLDVRVDESGAIVIELRERIPHESNPELGQLDGEFDDVDLAQWLVRGVREPEGLWTDGRSELGYHEHDARHAIWGPNEQWTLGGMQFDAEHGAQTRPECSSCHDAENFASAHGAPSRDVASPCSTCHVDVSDQDRFGLRIYENAQPVAGAAAEGLGSGAICIECHHVVGNSPHAPQADIVLGRGFRSLRSSDDGTSPHAAIADSCVACHAAPAHDADPETMTLGHTFMARDETGRISSNACRACHGAVQPDAIGKGDWDGDGRRGSVREEHDRALTRARQRVEAHVQRADIARQCGATRNSAWSFREHEGRIVLVDVRTVMLGDCDADGTFGQNERATTIDALPERVANAAFDVMQLERDGSRGVHNPTFAFAVLDAISQL